MRTSGQDSNARADELRRLEQVARAKMLSCPECGSREGMVSFERWHLQQAAPTADDAWYSHPNTDDVYQPCAVCNLGKHIEPQFTRLTHAQVLAWLSEEVKK